MEKKVSKRTEERHTNAVRAKRKLRLLVGGAMVGLLTLSFSEAVFLVILMDKSIAWAAFIGVVVAALGIIACIVSLHLADEEDMF